MTLIRQQISLETSAGLLESVEALFSIDEERFPAERKSWGESRGSEAYVTAQLESLELGFLTLKRNQVVQWIGESSVKAMEDSILETSA